MSSQPAEWFYMASSLVSKKNSGLPPLPKGSATKSMSSTSNTSSPSKAMNSLNRSIPYNSPSANRSSSPQVIKVHDKHSNDAVDPMDVPAVDRNARSVYNLRAGSTPDPLSLISPPAKKIKKSAVVNKGSLPSIGAPSSFANLPQISTSPMVKCNAEVQQKTRHQTQERLKREREKKEREEEMYRRRLVVKPAAELRKTVKPVEGTTHMSQKTRLSAISQENTLDSMMKGRKKKYEESVGSVPPMEVLSDDELAIFDIESIGSKSLESSQKEPSKNELDDEEKQMLKKSRELKKRTTRTNNLANETDDFHSRLLNSNVWIPSIHPASSSLQPHEPEHEDMSDLSFKVGSKDTFEVFDEERNLKKQRRIIDEKYKGKTYNGSLSYKELEREFEKHRSCVLQIIKGEIVSAYYAQAAEIVKKSSSTTASQEDFNNIRLSEFTIGYFGIKRQATIAQFISREFKQELQRSTLTNATVSWWSKDSFVLYILAAEVAARIAAEQLNIDVLDVYDLFAETVDYGKYVTDFESIH